ncbi:hypothetical protein ACFE04_005015 [Oxalis oulophora]
MWWKKSIKAVRHYSRVAPPKPAPAVIRVVNNIAQLGNPKEGPKPRQLLYLPPFPAYPLPGKDSVHVTAINWVKYYFDEIEQSVIESHFNKGLVQNSVTESERGMKKVKANDVMQLGMKLCMPVSVAETRISKRFDCIPTGTLYPNADEIKYLQRLVKYKDPAILVLNKPPKLPVKGIMPVHNSMDALAAAALSYDLEEGPKLLMKQLSRSGISWYFVVNAEVHRLDRESSGLILMGRTEKSVAHLNWLFSDPNRAKSSCKAWNDACQSTVQRYWALVIGSPKEKEGVIHTPLTKVFLNNGKTERIVLAQNCGLEPSQEAVTEYRVLGPTINGCSWVELCPRTSRKHQLRVHCAEALGTPIVGDYKYGWFVHKKWQQMPHLDYEPISGKPYKLRRPGGLDIQKGSVLSKVPLLHLHCRELVLPNIALFLDVLNKEKSKSRAVSSREPHLLRFVSRMPNHMKISWNLMSSYLV